MQKNGIWLACKYLRLSIEDGDKTESESIVNQAVMIDNYMKQVSDITIIETFKDDGFSGTDFNRPGFVSMMECIEKKEINCIIVKDLSRFGREHIDVDRYIQKVFPAMGVRFIAINDNYDSLTANMTDTHLVLPVKSFVNDTYCRQTSQKIRSHLEAKRGIGQYVGSYVVYGYKKSDQDKNEIEIDPVAAKHVKEIFEWKKEGLSNQQIADRLNKTGVMAPADYKRSMGIHFKSSFQTHLSSKWSAMAVGRILKNPIYCGDLEQGKSRRVNYKVKIQRDIPKEQWAVVENHHDAIIDRSSFNLIQLLNRKDTRIAPGEEKLYLFGGLLFCGDCGRTMIRRIKHYREKEKVYYICTTYNRQKGCSRHSIKEDDLVSIVQNGLKLYGQMTDAVRESVSFLKKHQINVQTLVQRDDLVLKLRRELEKYYKLVHSLSGSLANGIINKQDYKLLHDKYQDRIRELEEDIEHQETYIEELIENKLLCGQWAEQFLKKPDIGILDRDTLVHYIEKIVVYEDKRIEIIYRFQDELTAAARLSENIRLEVGG